jgi:hypothetical protein
MSAPQNAQRFGKALGLSALRRVEVTATFVDLQVLKDWMNLVFDNVEEWSIGKLGRYYRTRQEVNRRPFIRKVFRVSHDEYSILSIA